MAFVKIIIHAVWGTKYREPLLNKNLRFQLIGHMIENAKSKGIIMDRINGASDQEDHHMKKTFEEEYQEFLASVELI